MKKYVVSKGLRRSLKLLSKEAFAVGTTKILQVFLDKVPMLQEGGNSGKDDIGKCGG